MKKRRQLSKKQLLSIIRRLENNPKNYARIFGEVGVAGVGAAGAGAVAAVAGAGVAPIPIVTALTGFGLVVAAPATLVAGAAIAGGVATYGLTKTIVQAKNEEVEKKEAEQKFKDFSLIINNRLQQAEDKKSSLIDKDKAEFIIFLKTPILLDKLSPANAQGLIEYIDSEKSSLVEAYVKLMQYFLGVGQEDKVDNRTPKPQEEEEEKKVMKRLHARLLGDVDKAERLIQFERNRLPNASRLELILAAMERLDRDN